MSINRKNAILRDTFMQRTSKFKWRYPKRVLAYIQQLWKLQYLKISSPSIAPLELSFQIHVAAFFNTLGEGNPGSLQLAIGIPVAQVSVDDLGAGNSGCSQHIGSPLAQKPSPITKWLHR